MDRSSERLKLTKDSWLLEAVRKNNIADVRVLIEMGADINPQFNVWLDSPLLLAIRHGHKEIVNILISNGAIKDSHGEYPIHFAVAYGSKEIVQILINHGASIDENYEDGYTLLHAAIIMNDKAMVELLLKNGANIEAEGKKEETPLLKAVGKGNAEMVQLVISK